MTADDAWVLELFAQAADNPPEPVAVIVKPKACNRCGGEGRLSYFSHVKGGECFACHGTGHK